MKIGSAFYLDLSSETEVLPLIDIICFETQGSLAFEKIRQMSVITESRDILMQDQHLKEIWKHLGQCKESGDKVTVFNLLMFIGYFRYDLQQHIFCCLYVNIWTPLSK